MKIIFWPAKVLEQKADEVTKFDAGLAELVDSMKETMQNAAGIGLAANQVGVLKRVALIEIPYDDPDADDEEAESEIGPVQPWHDKLWVLVNPVITKSQGKTKYTEGCLSFPEVFEYVQRSEEVWVTAQDEKGKEYEIHGTGLFAIALQHEIDHLDGKPFTARMGRLKASMVKKKMMRKGQLQSMQDGEEQ